MSFSTHIFLAFIGLFLLGFHSLQAEALPDSSKPMILKIPSQKAVSKASASLQQTELNCLKEGDLLLRKGYGWVSDGIAQFLQEEFPVTHCAFILTEGYQEVHVLHTLSNEEVNGMLIEPLSRYLLESQEGSLIAVRPHCNAEETELIIQNAKRLWKKAIPFDLGFDDQDSSKLYCAELVAYVYKQVLNKDLISEKANFGGRMVIRMRNFYDPKEFQVLFNQFIK